MARMNLRLWCFNAASLSQLRLWRQHEMPAIGRLCCPRPSWSKLATAALRLSLQYVRPRHHVRRYVTRLSLDHLSPSCIELAAVLPCHCEMPTITTVTPALLLASLLHLNDACAKDFVCHHEEYAAKA